MGPGPGPSAGNRVAAYDRSFGRLCAGTVPALLGSGTAGASRLAGRAVLDAGTAEQFKYALMIALADASAIVGDVIDDLDAV